LGAAEEVVAPVEGFINEVRADQHPFGIDCIQDVGLDELNRRVQIPVELFIEALHHQSNGLAFIFEIGKVYLAVALRTVLAVDHQAKEITKALPAEVIDREGTTGIDLYDAAVSPQHLGPAEADVGRLPHGAVILGAAKEDLVHRVKSDRVKLRGREV